MSVQPKYSVVIPVYNRPEELDELLQSLAEQTFKDFEVLIIEDGSEKASQKVFEKYTSVLSIKYFFKPNSGPGPSRNYGFERASGKWFVVFDSDCILPPDYFDSIEKFTTAHTLDAWGGPDCGHEKFTVLQRAMAFTMTSLFTTGGIRGGKNQADKFQPRSFNMGISREVFVKTGGFKFDRLAEDIELSVRMRQAGFKVALIPEAFVYHKRRTDLAQFFRQVQGFGRGRVRVGNQYPEEVKVTHWFPALFLLSVLAIPFLFVFKPGLGWIAVWLLGFYSLSVFLDGWITSRSFVVALLAMPAAFVQLTGYGIGFLMEKFKRPAA